jgi:hypothetical protein
MSFVIVICHCQQCFSMIEHIFKLVIWDTITKNMNHYIEMQLQHLEFQTCLINKIKSYVIQITLDILESF